MRVRFTEKVVRPSLGVGVMALFLAAGVHAQNVGIGFTSPNSKLSVNGNLAIGANYNDAAPANGAIIESTVGIGTNTPNSNSMLHIYNPDEAEEIIEAGGGTGGFPALRLTNDSRTNHLGEIQLLNSDTSQGWIISGDAKADGTNWFSIYDQTDKISRIVIDPSGDVGLSSDPPRATLDVPNGANMNMGSGTESYFNYTTNSTIVTKSIAATPSVASAIFGNNVFTNGSFITFNGQLTASDARLKIKIGRSDSAKDLETLQKIEVTDYTMKDVVAFGSKPLKKVIAQQVEEVYPTAVKTVGLKAVTFTPDIYAVSTSVEVEKPGVYVISLAKEHGLKDGDIVRLITEDKNTQRNFQLAVHVVSDKTFSVETKAVLGDKVFVYGKNCLDLKSVDYDAIGMLNVSATQELAKKVEALEQQNHDLQDQNKRLTSVEEKEKQERATIAEQGAEIAALRVANEKLNAVVAKMEAVERAVARMQEKENSGVQTAALEQ